MHAKFSEEERKKKREEARKKYAEKHKDRIRERDIKYRKDNTDKINEQKRKYRKNNKEEVSERGRAYHKEHKETVNEKHRIYYKNNREKRLESSRVFRKKNRERIDYRKLLVRHNISKDQHDIYTALFGGRCNICGGEEKNNKKTNGHPMRLFLDHDHATGKVRGFLCNRCNLVLGNLNDSVSLFTAAAKYLEQSETADHFVKDTEDIHRYLQKKVQDFSNRG